MYSAELNKTIDIGSVLRMWICSKADERKCGLFCLLTAHRCLSTPSQSLVLNKKSSHQF